MEKVIFDKYAAYYDLLYQDKNYEREANYIDELIKKYFLDNASTVLDLGCGTGRHAELLSHKGYEIYGVDMSEVMLKEAYKRAKHNEKLSFSLADIQNFKLDKKFDIVTALFHVISYQITDIALKNVLMNVYHHLNAGGIFIFDCWYGPAVLSEKPEVRVKRLESEEIQVIRIAEPIMRENESIVEVHYDVFIKNKSSQEIKEVKETHIMRYYFQMEIIRLIRECGFTFVTDFEFMTDKPIDKSTWGSCFVVRK